MDRKEDSEDFKGKYSSRLCDKTFPSGQTLFPAKGLKPRTPCGYNYTRSSDLTYYKFCRVSIRGRHLWAAALHFCMQVFIKLLLLWQRRQEAQEGGEIGEKGHCSPTLCSHIPLTLCE